MASYNLAPIGNDAPFMLSTGVAASGYKLFTYTAGSTTKTNTYQDNAGNTLNANPILLNSSGYPASGGSVVEIWLIAGTNYKFVLAPSTDSDPPSSPVWTRDNLTGINDVTVTSSEWIAGPTPTYISATSFSLVGDQTGTFTVGRRIKTTNTAGTVYSIISNAAFTSLTTVTVINDSGTLDSGLSAVSYGILQATNSSLPLGTQNTNYVCQGRLTLTSGTAVTTADVTAATTVYFTPYKGNTIALYDGTKWTDWVFSELSIAVPATTSTMYDVWVYNNAGVLALEVLAWTNDTTRATALALQNGVYVKSGVTTRRYVGSFRTTGVSGQTEDSLAKRYVWNYYNRAYRPMKVVESTSSWTYSTAAYQQARATAANQLDYVQGVSEDAILARVQHHSTTSTSATFRTVYTGVGVDSTSANSAQIMTTGSGNSSNFVTPMSEYRGFPGVGRHTLVWLEYGVGTDTQTWYGNNGGTLLQSGITGDLFG